MLYGMGRARLGYLMHYLPYPVVAGLIGGLGVLLVIGGLELAVPSLRAGGFLDRARGLARAGGDRSVRHAALAAALSARPRCSTSRAWSWSAPSCSGWSPRARRPWTAGRCGPSRRPPTPVRGSSGRNSHEVDWRAIAAASPTLTMLVVFLAVILLTDAASLELALGRHLEPNQTLQTFGIANAAAGAIGGFTSVMSISGTIMAQRSGAACRLVGVTSGLVCARLLARRPGAARLAPGLRGRWPDRVRRARVRGRMGHSAVAAAERCRPGDPDRGRGRESASPASPWASSWACSWASSSSWSAAAVCRRSATRPPAATASAMSSAPRATATACARAATPSSSWSSAASCSSARPGGSMPASGGGRWTRRRPLCAPSCSTSAGSAASTARAGTISARSSSWPTSTHSMSS